MQILVPMVLGFGFLRRSTTYIPVGVRGKPYLACRVLIFLLYAFPRRSVGTSKTQTTLVPMVLGFGFLRRSTTYIPVGVRGKPYLSLHAVHTSINSSCPW